ncbi:MAG: cell division ATP-binding protein FtsE [Candidatus Pacebacteria bacterium]|nr:cell division ATP-binding protein FtsE [Candidatus Paceibacterota bacterium]
MIYFDKVTKIYQDGMKVIDDVSLSIEPEEFISIVGHSGAGKTTLLKMLLAEESPSDGFIFFESQDINKIKENKIYKHRQKIGVVFQDFRLLSNRTVYENIAFAMEAAGKTNDEIISDVPYVLKLVGLEGKTQNFPQELSGGEQQRVAIARAIVNQPDVLIADEPTGNLDPNNAKDIIDILQKVNELGTTVILTTHNKSIIENLGKKRVVTMENGKIIRDKSGGYIL